MKAGKPITAAAAALAMTAASICPIYADAASVQDSATATASSNVYDGFAVTNVESYCNVRSDASTDSEIVGVFYPGCVAEVMGEKDGWTEIASGNVTGYIRSDLLVTGNDVDTLISSGNYTSYARVNAVTLNVRSGAGLDNDIIGLYGEGEKLEVTGYENGWYKIDYDGTTGYVSGDWLRAGDGTHCALTEDEYAEYLNSIAEGAKDLDGDLIIDEYPQTDAESTSADTLTAEDTDDTTVASADSAADETSDTTDTTADTTDTTTDSTTASDTTDTATETSDAVSVSDSDLDLLAAIIYCEAGNQSYEGKVAVGAVVMNRVASSAYPSTIHDVIYQSGQFTPASSGALASALASGVPSSCYQAAQDALNGSDPTGGLLHFHAGQGSGLVIDGQTFY